MAAIHWDKAVSGSFADGSKWIGGSTPGSGDDAILDATGSAFIVTSTGGETVSSIQTGQKAELVIDKNMFTATNGTGSGANAGFIAVSDAAAFSVGGTITNSSIIFLESTGSVTEIFIGAAGATLSGGGEVSLFDNIGNQIGVYSTDATLTNLDNTIIGSGLIGDGHLSIANQAGGVIDASGSKADLEIRSPSFTNAGLVEATGSAGLVIFQTTLANTGAVKVAGGSVLELDNAALTDSAGGHILTAGGADILLNNGTIDGGSAELGAGATLTAKAGTGNVLATASFSNFGDIVVADTGSLTLSGIVANGGTISVNGAAFETDLSVAATGVSLTGAGDVILSDNMGNRVTSSTFGVVLTNVHNTIAGAGSIDVSINNEAGAVIDATGAKNALAVDGPTLTNAGLVEATGAAGLKLLAGTILNSGTITTAVTSVLQGRLMGGSGTLASSGSGAFEVSNTNFDGSAAAVRTAALVAVTDSQSLVFEGAIANSGTISLESTGGATNLYLYGASGTLQGGGKVALSDNAANAIQILVGTATLTNLDNTIYGSGQLGRFNQNGNLTIVNAAKGVIAATGSSAALILDTQGETMTNAGLLEATGAAGLDIANTTVVNTGTVYAAAGSVIDLKNATLTDSGAGHLLTASSSEILLDNGTIAGASAALAAGAVLTETAQGGGAITTSTFTNNGVILVPSDLTVSGVIANSGTVSIAANYSNLEIGTGGATFESGGRISMSDSSHNAIQSFSGLVTLTNVDNTISGAGKLGNGSIDIVNEAKGVIDASAAGNGLILQVPTLTNAGLVEASGAGGLTIVGTTIVNSGTLAAAGATVTLTADHLRGGTLITSGAGVFKIGFSTFDGSASLVKSAGAVDIADGASLTLMGLIDNAGTMSLASAGAVTSLLIGAGGAKLEGGGKITLSDFAANHIASESGVVSLINIDNTIAGSGQLGAGSLSILNQAKGVIDATGTNNALVLDATTFTNAGLLEAAGKAGLTIASTTLTNTGTVQVAAGSTLTLSSGALTQSGAGQFLTVSGSHVALVGGKISGPSLALAAGATLTATAGTLDTLAASSFTNQGVVTIADAAALAVSGAVANSGSFSIVSAGGATQILIGAGGLTLTGKGIVASNAVGGQILGSGASSKLTNVDNTIRGAGLISSLTLVNKAAGVINANLKGGLTLTKATVVNAGLIEASGAGALTIAGATVDDSGGGTIAAASAPVALQGADIIGGALTATGVGVFAVSGLSGILDGSAGHAVTLTGRLGVADKGALTLQGAIVNKGALSLQAGADVTRLIVGAAGTTLSGGGTVGLTDSTANQIISTTTATLTNVDNKILGAGTIGGASLTLINQAGGVISSTATKVLTINTGANTIANAGFIEGQGTGGTVVVSAVANNGHLAALNGSLTLDQAVTGAGVASVSNGTLTFLKGFSENVSFGASGTLVLFQSQTYAASLSGFAHTSATKLDLRDIGFVSAGEATFAGNANGGILNVTDGKHTAHIHMSGNYVGSVFTCASDGHGGTTIVDPPPPAPVIFAGAMAGFAPTAAASVAPSNTASHARPWTLATPAHGTNS